VSLYSEHPTVLVAGLETARREVLRQRLREAGFRVVATLTSALQTIQAAWELEPELCIVDVSLLGRGVPVVRPITVRLPSTKVVVTLPRLDADATVAAVGDGAAACVLEQELLADSSAVLRAALAGQAMFSADVARDLCDELRGARPSRAPFVTHAPIAR
jgi:two-component system, NarL family, nitrate/nitrite response regulator NarL